VLSPEIVERERLQEHPGIEGIVKEVARRFGVKHEMIRAGELGGIRPDRWLYICRTGIPVWIMKRLGGILESCTRAA